MTSEQLKNSILQFAVQGKLVPQIPHDEPASELIKKIKAEKEKLIKDKLIKKDKPLLPIKEEDKPFEIPESWEWVRLGSLATIISKGTTPTGGKDQYINQGVGFVRAENIGNDGKVHLENIKFISEITHKTSLSRSVLEGNDLLICIAGTLGRCAIVDNSQLPLNTNQAVSFVRIVNDKLVSLNYLQKIISSSFIQKHLISQTKVTAIPNLTLEIISNCIIPLPPLAEQQRIVDKIEELLPLVEQYGTVEQELRQLNAKFPEQLKKSVLQYAVQGKLVPQNPHDEPASVLLEKIKAEKKKLIKEKLIKQDKPLLEIKEDEIPFEIPDSWVWCRLGDIVNKLTDGTHYTPKYTETGIPFLSVKDMSSGKLVFGSSRYISLEEHKILYSRCNPQKGDLLLTKVGTTGIPIIVDTDKEFSLFVSVALIKFNTKLINSKFLVHLINSPLVQSQCTNATKGVGNKNWVMRDIANTLIVLPPLSEQQLIVEKVEEVLSYCDKLKIG